MKEGINLVEIGENHQLPHSPRKLFNKSCPEVLRQKVGMGLGLGVKINKLSAP